jgi:phosphatidylglycerophosphatase A
MTNPKTDSSSEALADLRPESESPARPRASLGAILLATAGCVGYTPIAPGTCGALVGVLIYWLLVGHRSLSSGIAFRRFGIPYAAPLIFSVVEVMIVISVFGLWAAHDVSLDLGQRDPQFVVIDEVSGQLLTYLVALSRGDWKYLVLGFALFRIFDIWKPFPIRRAELLPGGWGIMADDWVAGIYAGLGLWVARAAGM